MSLGSWLFVVLWSCCWHHFTQISLATTTTTTTRVVGVASVVFPDSSINNQFDRSITVDALPLRRTINSMLRDWTCASKFCLELRLTSEFSSDPFELDRYESKYTVSAAFLDPALAQNQRPVVDGFVSSDPTVWIFQSNFLLSDGLPVVDILLCMRQRSQRSAPRDQLLVHLNGTFTSAYGATLAVDSLSTYGSQQISYQTLWQSEHHLIVLLTVARNMTKNDANIHDALPPDQQNQQQEPPIYQWIWQYTAPECLLCTAQLYGCGSDDIWNGDCTYETTSSRFIKCLRAQLTSQAFTDWLGESSGSQHNIAATIVQCFNALPQTTQLIGDEWWQTVRAMSCLAQHNCPFGPLSIYSNTKDQVDKYITMANTASTTHTIWFPTGTDTALGSVVYWFPPFSSAMQSDSMDFIVASSSDLAALVNRTLNRGLPNALIDPQLIAVTREVTTEHIQVEITLHDLVFPSFFGNFQAGSSTLTVLKDNVVVQLPTLETKSSEFAQPADTWNWLWEYSSTQCLAITTSFLGCADPGQILSGACTFETSSDPFVSCLRQDGAAIFERLAWQYPTAMAQDARPVIEGCFNLLWSLQSLLPGSGSTNLWLNQLQNLIKLSKHQCPIGPLPRPLVDATPTNVVSLSDGSSVAHSMYIPNPTFSMRLNLSFGPFQTLTTPFFSDTWSEADIQDAIQTVLTDLVGEDLVVDVLKNYNSNSNQWEISILYHEVVFPGFASNAMLSDEYDGILTVSEQMQVNTIPMFQSNSFQATSLDSSRRCGECHKSLRNCQLDPSCRSQALWCIVSELQTASGAVDPNAGESAYDLYALVKTCFAKHPQATWRPLLRGLICLVDMHCSSDAFRLDFMPGTQVFSMVQTMFQVEWYDLASDNQKSMIFDDNLNQLRSFLKAYVVNDQGVLWVDSDYEPTLTVHLYYSGLPLTWPAFQANGLQMVTENPPTLILFSPASDLEASLSAVIELLLQYTNENGSPSSTAIALAIGYSSACTACYVSLFNCSTNEVLAGICSWSRNMQTPLAKCLSRRLPIARFESLRYQPLGTSISVQDEMEECVDQVSSMPGNISEIHKLVSCFPSSSCPVGPLQFAVGDVSMIRLRSSPYTHWFRIPSADFKIRLIFQFADSTVDTRDDAFVTPQLTSSMSRDQFRNTIQQSVPDQIVVQVRKLELVDFFEWHVQVDYLNVLFPKFHVIVFSEDPALRTANRFPQKHIRPCPRLVQSAQDQQVVCQKCQRFLHQCAAHHVCRDLVLPCLVQSIGSDLSGVTDSRVVISDVFPICFSAKTIASWLPMQKFLVCYADNACPLDSTDPATATTRLQLESSASMQLTIPSMTQTNGTVSFQITPVLNGVPELYMDLPFAGTIANLQSTLQDTILIGAARVVVTSQQVFVDNQIQTQLNIQFGEYFGDLPQVYGADVTATSQQAMVLAMQSTNGSIFWQQLKQLLMASI